MRTGVESLNRVAAGRCNEQHEKSGNGAVASGASQASHVHGGVGMRPICAPQLLSLSANEKHKSID